jgi:hypothetical protein
MKGPVHEMFQRQQLPYPKVALTALMLFGGRVMYDGLCQMKDHESGSLYLKARELIAAERRLAGETKST